MGRFRNHLPQPLQFVVELRQPESEGDEDQGPAASKVDTPPEIPDVERKQPFGHDALTLPQLLGVPIGSPGERSIARGKLSERRYEDFSDIDREGEELDVRLLDALEAERHDFLSKAALGCGG